MVTTWDASSNFTSCERNGNARQKELAACRAQSSPAHRPNSTRKPAHRPHNHAPNCPPHSACGVRWPDPGSFAPGVRGGCAGGIGRRPLHRSPSFPSQSLRNCNQSRIAAKAAKNVGQASLLGSTECFCHTADNVRHCSSVHSLLGGNACKTAERSTRESKPKIR